MKRILFVVYSLNIGGLERVVVDHANALDASSYQPFICCIATAGELSRYFCCPERLFVLNESGRMTMRSCVAIRDIIRRHGIDIIHSHNMAGLLRGFAAAKLLRIPLVHTNHGYVEGDKDSRFLNILERWMSKHVDKYVCVSEDLKRDVVDHLGLREDRVYVQYNGIRVQHESSVSGVRKDDAVRIGSVGRLGPIKNYPILLESFAEIVRKHASCTLQLIGGGEDYDSLVALRDKLMLQDKVVFTGPVLDVKERLKNIDIFTLVSLSEGLSISILEALSLGKVCVVSDVGGNTEIIRHGENGYLFNSGNKGDLVDKLDYAITNIRTAEMDELRKRARETIVQRFSLEGMVRNYCALYDEVASR